MPGKRHTAEEIVNKLREADVELAQGAGHWRGMQYPIDRDTMYLPEVVVERAQESQQSYLRPVFDALWSACGFTRCHHYNWSDEYMPNA